MISLIHPHTCGFAKVAAWTAARAVLSETERDVNVESLKDYESRKVQCIFGKFEDNFNGNSNFEIDFKTFRKKLPDLRKTFSTWNPRKFDERQKYLTTFSCEKRRQLGNERKAEHSLMDCQACSHRYVEQSFFPVSSKQFLGCQQANPLFVAENMS